MGSNSRNRLIPKIFSVITLSVSYFSVEHAPIITKQKMQRSFAESETVSRILYEEKAQELLAKDEMLQVITVVSPNIARPLTLRTSSSDYAKFNQNNLF